MLADDLHAAPAAIFGVAQSFSGRIWRKPL